MSDPLDTLFATPPSQFTHTRDQLAKSLSKDAAKELKSHKKPPVSVWLVNRLWRDERKQMDALLKLSSKLKHAQKEGPHAMAAAKKEQAALVETLRAAAERLLDETKEKAPAGTFERFETTLRTLAARGSFLPDEPGRLTEDKEIVGFEAAFDAPLPTKRAEPPNREDVARAAEEKRRALEEKKRLEAEERAKKAKAHTLELLRRKRAQILDELAAVDAEIKAVEG